MQVLTPELAIGYVAFVYIIVNNLTGRSYIGKKTLISKSRKKVKGRTNRKVVTKSSDWNKYWGSSKELLDDIEKYGKENFSRYVLRLCKSKGEASYYEAKFQMDFDVLLYPHAYYNSHIMCHIHRKHLVK